MMMSLFVERLALAIRRMPRRRLFLFQGLASQDLTPLKFASTPSIHGVYILSTKIDSTLNLRGWKEIKESS